MDEKILYGGKLYSEDWKPLGVVPKSNFYDKLGIAPLIEETVKGTGSVLVFCFSKRSCEQSCAFYSDKLRDSFQKNSKCLDSKIENLI